MSREITLPIAFDDIDIPEGRREVNPAVVKRLADSIEQVGLRHPITVRKRNDRYVLVAGRHRLEACRKIGRESVPATIVTMTNAEARMWEIAENLHRAELTKLERDEQVAEWIKLCEVLRQPDAKPQGGRPEGGVRAAARELGVSEPDARRATQVASIAPEAKEAIRDAGLDNNRSAMLEVAKEPTPEKQVAKVVQLAAPPLNDFESKERQVSALMTAWNKAGSEARAEFLSRIDKPIMDRRYGS